MTAPTTAQTQPVHDADDIVTEDMIDVAFEAEEDFIAPRSRMRAALRAVAPMIAARVLEIDRRANKEQP